MDIMVPYWGGGNEAEGLTDVGLVFVGYQHNARVRFREHNGAVGAAVGLILGKERACRAGGQNGAADQEEIRRNDVTAMTAGGG